MRRRLFLALGFAGAATFAAAGWWVAGRKWPADGLDVEAQEIVAALVPAMLGDALPASGVARGEAISETVRHVQRAIAGLPPAARAEIGQLFALLSLTPARRAFAGVASPWASASDAEIAAFLDSWRDSRWELKRSAYDALHQLINAAWYGNPRAWNAIGYPGPPALEGLGR